MKKKILTIDDLVKFCVENKMYDFKANDGSQLYVSVPATFESDEENSSETMLFVDVKLFHTGENRNKSSVTVEAAEKSLSTIKYKPILANFCEIDGVRDFTSHDIHIDDDGNLVYDEHQIGCFTADQPEMIYDEDKDRYYICCKGAIPREYTDAADIIERKNGTKISAEIGINAMSFDVKKGILMLEDIEIIGGTCLGKNPETGKNVEEGMEGARLDISDFTMNPPIKQFETDNKLVETLEKLNNTLSNFNIKTCEEGGTTMNKIDELLVKYNKTMEDVTFDCEGLTDEELEAKFEENFGESGSVGEETETFKKTFELSHDDVRVGLYELLLPYEESDNTWYYISEVYDDYFVYGSWGNNNTYWGQAYTKTDETVAFEGERYTLHCELLTDSEYTELQNMRTNYASLMEKVEKYETAEINAKKDEILNQECYANYLDSDEFKELIENKADYSVEELETKAELAFSKCVKKLGFALKAENKENKNSSISIGTKQTEKKGSFIEDLKNMSK